MEACLAPAKEDIMISGSSKASSYPGHFDQQTLSHTKHESERGGEVGRHHAMELSQPHTGAAILPEPFTEKEQWS